MKRDQYTSKETDKRDLRTSGSDMHMQICQKTLEIVEMRVSMGGLRLAGSIKSCVSFAGEPYKRDYILQKRPVI